MKKNKKATPTKKTEDSVPFESNPAPRLRQIEGDSTADEIPDVEYNAAFAVEFQELTGQKATPESVNVWVKATMMSDPLKLQKYFLVPEEQGDSKSEQPKKPSRPQEAKQLADLQAKAEKGDAIAQCELGAAFFNGKFGLEKDEDEAADWFRKAAIQGHAKAQYCLGFCYYNGLGVAKKWVEARNWWVKAAEQQYAPAQYALGNCYANGEAVVKDDAKAVELYLKAAEQNYAGAQNNLATCYADGQGVEQDYAEAYKWASLAAAQDIEQAKSVLEKLDEIMTPKQIVDGKRRAKEWLKQHKV